MNKIAKAIAVFVAAAMILSAAVLSGCGEKSSDGKKGSVVETQATTKETQSSTDSSDAQNSQQSAEDQTQEATAQNSDTDDDDDSNDNEKHGNITHDEACQIALNNCEYGTTVSIADPSEYNGNDCWHVVVVDTTGKYINCYVSSTFCEVFTDGNDPWGEEKHGNITHDEACEIALNNCEYGTDVTIADPSEYNGTDCWHVVVVDTTGKYIECYVSSTFCEILYANNYEGNEVEQQEEIVID